MNSMAIDRRSFLITGAAALGWAGAKRACAADPLLPCYLTAATRADGRFVLVVVAMDGRIERELLLDARGHDAALSPDRRLAVAFARRPGTFALAIDLAETRPPRVFVAPPDRHFFGHGVFSADGRLLYATENDFENARGVLGVYDVGGGFRRIGEIATHGVGPHDVLLLPDGRTLCVANGGIDTHPASGSAKLNLDTMQPSLAFIDRLSGDLVASHVLPRDLHHLSLRHLCVDAASRVWFGAQWEGAVEEAPELIGLAGPDMPVRLIEPKPPWGVRLNGYIGSVAASGDRRIIAATAPRTGLTVYIDAESQRVVGEMLMPDCCGAAPAEGSGIAISSGLGRLRIEQPGGVPLTDRVVPRLAFDNHMRRLLPPRT
jgi:hypothetical protein